MARVLADHHDTAVATNHLALVTDLLNAGVDLHRLPSSFSGGPSCLYSPSQLLVPVDDASPGEVVGRKLHDHAVIGKDPDVVHPHLSGDMCENLVTVI
jgi:hypothetical protein